MHFWYNMKRVETTKAERQKLMEEKKKVLKEFATLANTVGDCTGTKEEFGPNWCQEKDRKLWTNVKVLYHDEDKEQDEKFQGKIWKMVGGCKGVFYKAIGEKLGLT